MPILPRWAFMACPRTKSTFTFTFLSIPYFLNVTCSGWHPWHSTHCHSRGLKLCKAACHKTPLLAPLPFSPTTTWLSLHNKTRPHDALITRWVREGLQQTAGYRGIWALLQNAANIFGQWVRNGCCDPHNKAKFADGGTAFSYGG
jgi:hypothetical protein